MKKVYLIHGWGDNTTDVTWFPWLKEELKKKDIKVISFNMPNTDEPKINEWVGYLKENINLKDLDEETYFVGHSIGCQTIMRFLEQLPKDKKVAGAIFVAGWFNLLETAYEEEGEKEIGKPWIETPINFKKVKEHTKNFLAIFSEDDPCVPVSDSELFKEKLNAKIVIRKNEGHFDETFEIPEVLEMIN